MSHMTDDDMSSDELVPLDESDWTMVRDNLCEMLRLEPENSWHWLVMSIVNARLGDPRAAAAAADMARNMASSTSVVARILRTLSPHMSQGHTECDIHGAMQSPLLQDATNICTDTTDDAIDYCCDECDKDSPNGRDNTPDDGSR